MDRVAERGLNEDGNLNVLLDSIEANKCQGSRHIMTA